VYYLGAENPVLKVIKQTNQHRMEEVGLWGIAQDTGNMVIRVQSSVNTV
jgi:hypothetical protein